MMPYTLHAGLIIAGCLIFYKVFLQKETFFRLNRWVLMICLLLAFCLPLIPVPQQWSFRKTEEPVVAVHTNADLPVYDTGVPQTAAQPLPAAAPEKKPVISWPQVVVWLYWLYWFGVIVFAARFLLQIIALLYRAYTRPVIKDGRFRIVELSGDKAPCSFGNNIFINPEKYDWDTYNQILLHEKTHIQQGHSFDILLAEMVIIFQWFNPFAWLYRKALENNLEFLTDDQLVHHYNVERTAYQMSLLKVSAPHFPLSVTTNYNQSLLKKRIAMMNSKKSNVHTTWKYLFLFPVLVLFVCLLNEPAAVAQTTAADKESNKESSKESDKKRNNDDFGLPTEGYWFATIDKDEVEIQFKSDGEKHSTNSSTFLLSEFKDLPKEKSGAFTLTREAGTIEFTGKFEGNQGMGRYQFTADKSYGEAMRKAGIEIKDDKDQLVFFMVNIKQSYVQMLKDNGYTTLTKHDLIPLAALKVDAAYIQSIKKQFSTIGLHDYIPLKSLHVTGDYVEEIRKAGYPNVTVHQIISFKAQHVDGKYIADVLAASKSEKKEKTEKREKAEKAEKPEKPEQPERAEREEKEDMSAHDIVALKALKIDLAYITSLKEVGYDNLSNHHLIALKSQNIDAVYIKKLQAAGYKDIPVSRLIAIKSQNITPEYLKTFEGTGITPLSIEQAVPVKSMAITPEYIRSFWDMGYKDISWRKVISLKSQSITPDLVREYKALGFDEVSLDDVIHAKATKTTPSFIASMQQKGHKLSTIRKYVQLKNIVTE